MTMDWEPLKSADTAATNRRHRTLIVGALLVGTPHEASNISSRATPKVAPTNILLGDVVGAFKSLTTDAYIHGVKTSGWPSFQGRLWQRNYYEHIIRNEAALEQIRQYIADNPVRWAFDSENPSRITP
ncbi:MAG: transposase [Candidatus Binatia bacterium]